MRLDSEPNQDGAVLVIKDECRTTLTSAETLPDNVRGSCQSWPSNFASGPHDVTVGERRKVKSSQVATTVPAESTASLTRSVAPSIGPIRVMGPQRPLVRDDDVRPGVPVWPVLHGIELGQRPMSDAR